ncbi:sensor histidine kinase [Alkalilimnicola sp. S0819]|uniref:sensor histidine kinase n=1 Tax=Alkalilimnicola sp. S0819 TaxID=2613922 RepID=UPI001262798A|nr:sensor histidine kinase [Alkalilimnicola sp. S0819]KAB7624166.1 sensor histidine kinase [Alkalilimnicola sp. S0819]MPQ16419.1 hypothetical protein [Alkalilimnicola sp. S0819]
MPQRWLFILFLLLGNPAALAGTATGDSWFLDSTAVLVDKEGTETIHSVSDPARAGDFQPSPAGLSAGYTRRVHWLRIRLAPPPGGELLLEIQPPYLDDLRLYIPDGVGGYTRHQTGDHYPYAQRAIPHRAYTFRVHFAKAAPQTVYLRVQTTSTSLAFPRAFVPDAYAAQISTEYLLLGLYYGALLVMLLFNLWHGHWRHDPDHRAFLYYLLATLLFMVSLNGLVAQYLAPRHPAVGDHMVSAMLMIIIAVAAHFHRRMLGVDRSTPLLNAYFIGIIGFAVLCLLAWPAGYFTEAARVLTLITLSFPLIGIVRSALRWRRAGSGFLTLAYITTLTSYLIPLLSVQGLLPNGPWQLYGLQIGGLAALGAFNFSLFERLRRLQEERDQAEEQGQRTRMELETEYRARQRQSSLIDMLSHEIKSPLSVIQLRLGVRSASERMQQHALRAAQAINDIVERCDYANRLDNQATQQRLAPCDLAAITAASLAHRGAQARTDVWLPPGLSTTVESDQAMVGVLLGNLIDNACKYAPPQARLSIRYTARSEDGREGLALSIANPTPLRGRPDPDRIFKRYYRAPGAQGKSGSGLGLAIAQALAEQLRGSLVYQPEQTEVVFELWLPYAAS